MVLDEDADAQEADEATGRLRRELLALDVDAVERVSAGEPPEGTRAVDMAAVGSLAVSMARSPMMLAQLVRSIQGWVAGRASRSVKIELDGDTLEVTGVSSADQQRLIDSWLARHSTDS